VRTEAVSLADAECYRNCLIYAHSYTNGDSNGYSDNYTYTNAHCQAQRNTEVASYAGAATDAVAAWPPEPNSFFQRVEDNAFHLGCERHGGSASPKTMAEESLKAQAKAKQAAAMG
jgi:hypothetical protein